MQVDAYSDPKTVEIRVAFKRSALDDSGHDDPGRIFEEEAFGGNAAMAESKADEHKWQNEIPQPARDCIYHDEGAGDA